MNRIHFLVASLLVITPLGACSSDMPVTGVAAQAVTGAGSAATTSTDIVDDGASAFTLQDAYVHLRDIELDLPDGVTCADIAEPLAGATCDAGSDKIVVQGPFDIDLMTGASTPDLALVEIPVGTYQRIDFRVDDNPAETSFALTADFERDAQTYTLELALDFNEDIRVEDPAGVSVTEDTDLIAEFVVDDWLAGVDIGGCMDDGDVVMDGTTVRVDETSTSGSCSGIEDTIKTNMKESGQLDRE